MAGSTANRFEICAVKFELSDGADMRGLVSCALSFVHKQRGQLCHRIDIQNFIWHEAVSNGGVRVLQ